MPERSFQDGFARALRADVTALSTSEASAAKTEHMPSSVLMDSQWTSSLVNVLVFKLTRG